VGKKVNRPSGSSTLWVSAQPVSRFAPPEAWATVHAEPHAPRESQHLRLLNVRVYDRKVNLPRASDSVTRRVTPNDWTTCDSRVQMRDATADLDVRAVKQFARLAANGSGVDS
jgi:hypothetical protein